MEMQRNKGFAPGHISAFFAPAYHKNLLRTGSYGAGVSITSGTVAEVMIEEAEHLEIVTMVNDNVRKLEVTEEAVRLLLRGKKQKFRVVCNLKPMLPISQGFGMSAAGAISVLLAICKILRISYSNALEAAHVAEVNQRTGLGDVAGIYAGGYEIRIKPGIPPYGIVDRIISSEKENRLILCVLGSELETKKILADEKAVKLCSVVGRKKLAKLLKEPTVTNLCNCGFEFAKETGLASEEILGSIEALGRAKIPASMAMLGNSVFAVVNEKNRKIAEDILMSYGKIFHTKVWHPL